MSYALNDSNVRILEQIGYNVGTYEIDLPKGDVVFKMETIVSGETFTIESFKVKEESSDTWRDVVNAESLKIEGKTSVSVSGHVGSSQEYDELSGDIPADSFIQLYLGEHRN